MRFLFLTFSLSTASAALTLSLVPSANSEERANLGHYFSLARADAPTVTVPQAQLPTVKHFSKPRADTDCSNGLTLLVAALAGKACS